MQKINVWIIAIVCCMYSPIHGMQVTAKGTNKIAVLKRLQNQPDKKFELRNVPPAQAETVTPEAVKTSFISMLNALSEEETSVFAVHGEKLTKKESKQQRTTVVDFSKLHLLQLPVPSKEMDTQSTAPTLEQVPAPAPVVLKPTFLQRVTDPVTLGTALVAGTLVYYFAKNKSE